MIDIKKLNELSAVLNMREFCRQAGIPYQNIVAKLRRFRENPEHGELKMSESQKLSRIYNKHFVYKS